MFANHKINKMMYTYLSFLASNYILTATGPQFINQHLLLCPLQILNQSFSSGSGRTAVAVLKIHNLQRMPPAKILGTVPGRMLVEASFNISGTTGIKGIIRTEDYIDVPIHNYSQLICGSFCADRLCDITA